MFVLVLTILLAIFLYIQFVYISHLPLVMDEFVSAHKAYKIYKAVPYAEYMPYKNLLAYTLHGAMLIFSGSHWSGLIIVKIYLVILNASMLLLGSLLLQKHLRYQAVLASLSLLIVMSTFLERSAELRVDMTAAWMGFLSLLLILKKRWCWAGVFAGISFLVTQKAIYYIFAGEATILYAICLYRDRKTLSNFILFNAGIFSVILLYFLVWSFISGTPINVMKGMLFLHGKKVLFFNPYGNMHISYWGQSLCRNPFYYLMMFVALLRLNDFRRLKPQDKFLQTIVPYSAIIILCCFVHSKPWPYFLVMLYPSVFVLIAVFLDREIEAKPTSVKFLGMAPPLFTMFVLIGILFPLTRFGTVTDRDLSFQKANVELAEKILNDGETYIAGIPFLYKKNQSHPDLESLSMINLIKINQSGSITIDKYIESISTSKTKFYIYSYRIEGLPEPIKNFLFSNFIHLYGNLYIYAPTIYPGEDSFSIKFTGLYELLSDQPLTLDNVVYNPGHTLHLSAGSHNFVIGKNKAFRLKFIPENLEMETDLRFKDPKILFDKVYTY